MSLGLKRVAIINIAMEIFKWAHARWICIETIIFYIVIFSLLNGVRSPTFSWAQIITKWSPYIVCLATTLEHGAPGFHTSPIGIITSAMLFLEDPSIHWPLDRIGCDSVFYLIAKYAADWLHKLFTCLQTFIPTLCTSMSLQDQVQELYCRSNHFYHIWTSVYLYLVALHCRQVSPYAILMILWSYATSLTFSFHSMLSFLVFFCFQCLPLFCFLLSV